MPPNSRTGRYIPKRLRRVNDAARILHEETTRSKKMQKILAGKFRQMSNFVARALGRVKNTIRRIRNAPEVVKATR